MALDQILRHEIDVIDFLNHMRWKELLRCDQQQYTVIVQHIGCIHNEATVPV